VCVEAAWAREEEKFPGTMVSTRQTAVEKTVQSIRSKLKDISNDVDAGAKRAAAPPSKTSDVGPPSTVPPVEQGITTRSRSAKKPQAKVEKKSQDDAKSNDDAEEVVAPTRLFDEAGATETTAVSSANGKKRKAEADGDDKYNKTRRVTRAAARKLSGASRPFPGRPTQPLSPPFFFFKRKFAACQNITKRFCRNQHRRRKESVYLMAPLNNPLRCNRWWGGGGCRGGGPDVRREARRRQRCVTPAATNPSHVFFLARDRKLFLLRSK
jgi:hypothetical protein